jgi:CRISPR-associated protein Csd1
MILQSLYNLYLRKKNELSPEGFQEKEIPFLIELDRHGNFCKLQDTRSKHGKKLVARRFRVPEERERSGKNAWQITNLLWDHYGYVLEWPKSDSAPDKEMAKKQHSSFVSSVEKLHLAYPEDEGINAVNLFLKSDSKQNIFQDSLWSECKKILGCNLSFRLNDTQALVCENDNVRASLAKVSEMDDDGEETDGASSLNVEGMCLITGERSSIARLHRRTPVLGSKSNAKIVSFQKNMGFDSYGKEQSYNAPTSKSAVFAYTTALNFLLSKGSRQKMQIGDTTTVFWAEKELELENNFASIFGFEASDLNKEVTNQKRAEYMRSLLKAPDSGHISSPDVGTRFYVLGLAPNAARISVRFWFVGSVTEVEQNIRSHFDDIEIIHSERDDDYPKLWLLLKSLALKGDVDKHLPPNISGDWMRAILSGGSYPKTLLMAALRRIRAEREVGFSRASIIKGCLNRVVRYYHQNEKEVSVSLDESNQNQGYLSGRLFAVLERCQTRANPGLNATIRDRFYGAASTTPVVAFPHLLKLNKHHLTKLENKGESFNLNKLIGEIVDGIMALGFPAHLNLEDQGRFAIGYYHQNQAFFKKKTDSSENMEKGED